MTQEGLRRGVLIVVLSVANATPARADSLQTAGDEIVIGIVAVTAAIAVLATVLILHYKSKKAAITGCVISGDDGMTVTDEKDRRTYALSGNTTGIKPGDRMRLQGKAVKPKSPEKTLVWEAKEVTKDFGVCPP
jgi:hypothetical protein